MKILKLFPLLSILLSSCSFNFDINYWVYKRIVIFGIDGAGSCFEKVDTPNFDKIFKHGNINYHGKTQTISNSAQNWASMIYGVKAEIHNKTNDVISSKKHTDENIPSFFKTYAQNHPNETFYSAVSWSPINYGIIEDNIPGMTKESSVQWTTATDYSYKDYIMTGVMRKRIQEYDDVIMFFQLGFVDEAGHMYGGDSKEYFDAIKETDNNLGILYSTFKETKKIYQTLFIAVSDHGHTHEGGHGGQSDRETDAMLAVSKGLGGTLEGTSIGYETHDLASIVLQSLGEKLPSHYEGSIPNNLFYNNDNK